MSKIDALPTSSLGGTGVTGADQAELAGQATKDITATNEGGFLSQWTARASKLGSHRFVRPLVNNPVARFLSYGSRYNVSPIP